jgi:hypothetical protein
MSDLWQDEGFGSAGAAGGGDDDDWDEGEESIELSLEDGFDDPDDAEQLEDDGWGEEGDG